MLHTSGHKTFARCRRCCYGREECEQVPIRSIDLSVSPPGVGVNRVMRTVGWMPYVRVLLSNRLCMVWLW